MSNETRERTGIELATLSPDSMLGFFLMRLDEMDARLDNPEWNFVEFRLEDNSDFTELEISRSLGLRLGATTPRIEVAGASSVRTVTFRRTNYIVELHGTGFTVSSFDYISWAERAEFDTNPNLGDFPDSDDARVLGSTSQSLQVFNDLPPEFKNVLRVAERYIPILTNDDLIECYA